MSVTPRRRGRIVAAAALAACAAIAAGAFQSFYLRIYTMDHAAFGASMTRLAYRRIPGLRTLLVEVDRRTPRGARILLVLPHRPWQGGYGYGFRRAQYMLEGKQVVPLLDRATDRLALQNIEKADYVVCWRNCNPPPRFEPIWRGPDGVLLRRIP